MFQKIKVVLPESTGLHRGVHLGGPTITPEFPAGHKKTMLQGSWR